MKSKLALSLVIVPCLGILVASAVAQTFQSTTGQQNQAANARLNQSNFVPDSRVSPFGVNGTQHGQRGATEYGTPFFRHGDDVESSGPSITPLVEQLKEAKTDTDRDKIKVQLKEVLDTQFAAHQQRHEKELADLESKVKKLKDLVAKRQENRREIVANRLDQIMRDAQGLGW